MVVTVRDDCLMQGAGSDSKRGRGARPREPRSDG